MRKFIVGGNWKMNGNKALVQEISESLNGNQFNVEVVVAPPAPLLSITRQALDKTVGVAAQNCSQIEKGAYTGEVSVSMLKDLGIEWVILGHSERREIFKESSELIGKKVAFAIKNGMNVIACCGEKLEDRQSGKTMDVVIEQLKGITSEISASDWNQVVLAYEPVWAIGTGVVATPQQVCKHFHFKCSIDTNA